MKGSPLVKRKSFEKVVLPSSNKSTLRGTLLAVSATIIVSSDAVLFIQSTHMGASHRGAIFWKLTGAFIVNAIEAIFEYVEEPAHMKDFLLHENWLYFVFSIGVTNAGISILLSLSFVLTYTANGLLGYACNVVWGAFLGVLVLGDKVEYHTCVWSIVIFCGIGVMAWDTATQGDTDQIIGDLCGLIAGLCFAIFLIENRRAEQRGIQIPIGFVLSVALLFAMCATLLSGYVYEALFFARLGSLSTPVYAAMIATVDGFVMGIISPLFGAAAENIPAARVSLIALCEIPCATLLVYFLFHQEQTFLGLIGDAIVLLGLIGNGTSEVLASLPEAQNDDRIDLLPSSSHHGTAAGHHTSSMLAQHDIISEESPLIDR